MPENIKILTGHVSPETAYLVDDYPYGFRLRCKIRYWLEYTPRRGFRFWSQTTNPKRPGEVWNKPKASTYCRFGACMFLNAEGHVEWTGIHEYTDHDKIPAWVATFGPGVPEAGRAVMDQWARTVAEYEAAKAAGQITITTTITTPAGVEVYSETAKQISQ